MDSGIFWYICVEYDDTGCISLDKKCVDVIADDGFYRESIALEFGRYAPVMGMFFCDKENCILHR